MIFVTNATGNVGSELVAQLIAAGAQVRVLARDSAKVRSRFADNVEVAAGNLDQPQSLVTAMKGCEKLFLLSPGPAIAQQDANVLSAAKQAGVRHVVKLSSMGADWEPATRLAGAHRPGEINVQSIGSAWTILRPSAFMSNALAWRDSVRKSGKIARPTGLGRIAVVDPYDIAAAAVRVLCSDGHDGKEYLLTGPESLNTAEQVACLSAVINQPLSYLDIPDAAAREGMLQSGIPAPYVEGLMDFFTLIKSGRGDIMSPDLGNLLDRAPRSFTTWAQAHRAHFG